MNDASKQVSVEALAEDYLERTRRGESPAISEYTAKYPQLADEIEDIFPALELMEDFKPASGDLSDESASNRPTAPVLRQVADYRILKEIGRGGMGVVYEAEQQSLGRRVALKVLPESSACGTKMLDRFQREARAAAKMHHTNIVPVFEVGHDDQCAFYAMQLIQGQGLDAVIGDLRDLRSAHTGNADVDSEKPERQVARNRLAHSLMTGHFHCARLSDSSSNVVDEATSPHWKDAPASGDSIPRPLLDNPALIETTVAAAGSTVSASLPGEGDLSTAEDNRRAYFRSVAEIGHQCAEALSYAHARGIIHRDIKPSNLLLDTNGVVWVTDFGLAKTGDVGLTQTGDILGTIRYMSPERFRGQCDNRADVYSLGLTLYEMLVLKPAYESPDRLKLIDIVTKTEVTAPRTIDSRIPRDLETIVLKACEKDPKRRYQSADDMADDLQRFVHDEPILARRASTAERVARWSRRNPWLATSVSVSAAALFAIAGISIVAAQTQATLNDQLTDANTELNEKTQELGETNQALVDSNKSKEELIRDLRSSQSRLAEKQAEFVAEKGDLPQAMLWLSRSFEQADPSDSQTRKRLLAKLTQTDRQMPQLIREVPFSASPEDVTLLEYVRRLIDPKDRLTQGFFLRELHGTPRENRRSATILPLTTSIIDSAQRIKTTIRCYDTRSGMWTGKPLTCGGVILSYDFHEKKRLLATVSCDATVAAQARTESAPNPAVPRRKSTMRKLTQVRNIDSGDVVYESYTDFQGARIDAVTVRNMYSAMGTRIAFEADGTSMISVIPDGKFRSSDPAFVIERVEFASGISTTRPVGPSLTESGDFRHPSPIVCRSGKRLLVLNTPLARGSLASRRASELLSLDVENDKLHGPPIRFDEGRPFAMTDAGDRVAVIRSDEIGRRIQIHDVASGEQLGTSIDLDVPVSTTVQITHFSTRHNRLVLSYLPPSSAADDTTANTVGWVRVFDLESARPVTPRLPTSGAVLEAVLTQDQQLVVRDQMHIRTWSLRGENVARTVFVGPSSHMTRPSAAARHSFQPIAEGHLLRAHNVGEVEVSKWSSDGSKISASTLRAEGFVAKAFDRSGRFLMLQSVTMTRSFDRLASQPHLGFMVEAWDLQDHSKVASRMSLPEGYNAVALGSSGRVVAIVSFVPAHRRESQEAIRLLDLKTQKIREVPNPRADFAPDYITFGSGDQHLYVVGGPEAVLDVFDLSQNSVTHLATHRLSGFRSTRSRLTSLTSGEFWNGSWDVSDDGTLVAGFTESGSLQVQDVQSGVTLHSANLPANGPGFGAPQRVFFSPEADAVFFSRIGGLIFRTEMEGEWSTDSMNVTESVRTATGLKLGEKDEVQIANLAVDSPWTNNNDLRAETLTARELRAMKRFRDLDWEPAADELAAWSLRRPDDWVPLVLRILPLAKLDRFEEADAAVTQLIRIVDKPTANAWLAHLDTLRSESLRYSQRSRVPETPESIRRHRWFLDRQLELATSDDERAHLLVSFAKTAELQSNFDQAIESIDQALRLAPDSTDVHKYRAHLMERLNRWDEALESRQALWRIRPDHRNAAFRFLGALAFADKREQFLETWGQFHDRNRERLKLPEEETFASGLSIAAGTRDRLAKPRLVFGGPRDDGFEAALKMADANYESPKAMSQDVADFYRFCKGLAEYRRGEPENLRASIEILDEALKGFSENYTYGAAITKFVAAMAHDKLGDAETARQAYFDGLDHHLLEADRIRNSASRAANDWQLAEVMRREAETQLKIDVDKIDVAVSDTTSWKVLFEDNFNDGISADWKQLDGDWNLVEGAASVEFDRKDERNVKQIERSIPGLPDTYEIGYTVKIGENSFVVLSMKSAVGADLNNRHAVALNVKENVWLMRRGLPGTGVSVDTTALGGTWFPAHNPDLKIRPNQTYQVRIIRQPRRITVFIDGQHVLSERVRDTATRAIRFFARGEHGSKVFIDNVVVRVP